MAREHSHQWQQTLWDLQKRYGDHVIGRLRDVATHSGMSTTFPSLDAALSRQGIPRGRVTALAAASSSTTGLTSLTYHIVAQAQHEAPAIYLDLAATLDADYAARCGVALDRLLVVQGLDLVHALGLTRDVLNAGSPSLIVLDAATVNELPTAAQFATLLRRMTEPLVKSPCAVLFLLPAPSRLSQAVDETVDTSLVIERRQWLKRGRDVIGYTVEVTILKDKQQVDRRHVLLDMPLHRAADGDAL